jgi:hypothetical protein
MRLVCSTVSPARRPLNGGSKSSRTRGYSGWSRYARLQKSGANIRNVWRASLITDSAIRQRLRMRVPFGAIGEP